MPKNLDQSRTHRRQFQFRLRTLLIAVAVLTVPMAWVGYSLNWIKQRREATNRVPEPNCFISTWPTDDTPAPRGLWIFGEWGYAVIHYDGRPEEREWFARLFPEARLISRDEQIRQLTESMAAPE